MLNKGITALKKELKRLRLEPAGSELVSVLNKLAYAHLHSNPREAKACVLEARDLAEKLELPAGQAENYRMLGMINLEVGTLLRRCRIVGNPWRSLRSSGTRAVWHLFTEPWQKPARFRV